MSVALSGVSIYVGAKHRADEHKWHESQRACRDCGIEAVRDWIDRYWLKYARGCWLEHICGSRLYMEFHLSQFGVLDSLERRLGDLFDRLRAFLENGRENLDIINWALDHDADIDMVIEFLEAVDMNSCRLSCHLLESYDTSHTVAA
jgi:hypothetical protein